MDATLKAVTHSVESMLKRRIYGLLGGYEDLNDHDALRKHSVAQILSGKVAGEGAELRPSNIDPSLGTEAALGNLVPRLRNQ